MKENYVIEQLEQSISVFQKLLSGIPNELIHWRYQPEKWNLLEVVCHLGDEEREDFRARVNHVLHDSQSPMVKIDPVAWVTERKYSQRDFSEAVNDFLSERKKSIEWLRSLKQPDWSSFYRHPKVGPVPASLLLTNWLAHDYLHIRQIIKLKYDYLAAVSGEKMDYAGNW